MPIITKLKCGLRFLHEADDDDDDDDDAIQWLKNRATTSLAKRNEYSHKAVLMSTHPRLSIADAEYECFMRHLLVLQTLGEMAIRRPTPTCAQQ